MDKPHVLNLLERASSTLVARIPFLAGQVINENASQLPESTNTSIPTFANYIVTPMEHSSTSVLRFRHLEATYTSYTALLAAKVPVSMLDSDVLAPMKGLPYIYPDASTTPVFKIQANFIQGGLILCFSGLHSAIDGTGMGQVIRLFAAACRGEKFSAADTTAMDLDRTNIPPPPYSYEKANDHFDLLWKPDLETTAATANTKKTAPALRKKEEEEEEDSACKWSYFRLPVSPLHAFKARVITTLPTDIAYITTNDILTAMTWRALTRARSERLFRSTTTSTLMRVVNGRRLLSPKIPDPYFGNLILTAFHTASMADITASHRSGSNDSTDTSLLALVFAIRRSTDAVNGAYFRSVGAYLRSLSPNERARFTFGISATKIATGAYVTSWAGMLDGVGPFGAILGKPECVRRPVFETAEGMVFIMPQCGGDGKEEGWFDVLIGLRDDDLKRLVADKESEFGRIAEYIG
ncbi:hypothetical protein MMC11_000307 [Xylographa trunciseda]|nr:hypothetical protein [Xylographa trunciseda]